MKHLLMISLALVMTLGAITGNSQNTKATITTISPKVEVIYFHYTRRCETCLTLEKNTQLALESLYSAKVKSGEYTFKSINLDDASSKSVSEKYGIGGQTLLVISSGKKSDITGQGFTNAKNLEKIKEEIKKAIDKVTKK